LRAVLGCEDEGVALEIARYGRVVGWKLSAVEGGEGPEEFPGAFQGSHIVKTAVLVIWTGSGSGEI
jgi:hypothetical protein